ncbi:OLC1v1016269C1 [Oldenlandia corymbosa var. corymbosa]|uniref:OLC1v1016269C1 n=1 Tax=Oldenlandia corymbosa var. corymbosa TaxID=529605 RepID=A0AAV1E7E1_OLDCO|nr:OLC1v1016269C1 [Oldenlandia corymbosa var. corymbosa]
MDPPQDTDSNAQAASKPRADTAATNPSAQPNAQGGVTSGSVAATARTSSSGLSAKEKKMIPVDVQETAAEDLPQEASNLPVSPPQIVEPGCAPNPSAQPVAETNKFSVLSSIQEIEDEIGSNEDFIESVYVEDSPKVGETCRVDDHVESRVLALMSLTEIPHIFSDDAEIGLHGAGLENEMGSWSEGEKDEVLVQGDVRGDFTVTKKRGRKSKEERARSQEGFKRNNMGAPWMVCGDFNVIRCLDEYNGVSVQDHSAIEDFNMCIQACNLLEIPAVGEDFTWGGTRQTGWVSKKLDRVLFSNEWLDLFQVNSIENLSRKTSDHSPMLHMFGVQGVSKPRVFQFQQMWLQRPEFISVVKENWEQPIDGFGMIAFSLKLRRLKAKLKEWNKSCFGDVFANLKEAEATVQHFEKHDLIIFTKGTQRSLRRLNTFFEQYEKATGQKISRDKRSFVASEKCSSRRIDIIKGTLGMQHGAFPFTYLGCRIFNGRKKAAIFQFLLDAMDAKLLNWKNKFLSPGGRLMLIRYVLSSMPRHVFSAIPPPKSVIRAMEARCQKFLWEGSSEAKKRHWRSWERVTFPVHENGLGLRSFEDVISALTSKLWWKLKNNKGIWSAFLHSLSHLAKEKTSWARVMKVSERAISFSKIIVRSGDRSFWFNNWGPNGVFWVKAFDEPPWPDLCIREFLENKDQYLPAL